MIKNTVLILAYDVYPGPIEVSQFAAECKDS